MPCYRCQTRQTDPARGPSAWRRGVVGGRLVLVCPDCQQEHDWTGDLDRCTSCGSTSLGRHLGVTVCRACGHEEAAAPDDTAPGEAAPEDARALSDDVEAALRRVLGRDGG